MKVRWPRPNKRALIIIIIIIMLVEITRGIKSGKRDKEVLFWRSLQFC
jgi:hypothetical protein